MGCGVNGNTLGCYPREWEFDPPRPSHFSGSRLDGKPPALGAGESEFDSRDPDLKMGTRCCWRHAGPANPMDGFETHSLHHSAAVAERSRREFPKLVDAGSSPAGSFVRARVAQRKSDTRGEGLMRVQVSSRAPGLRQKAEGGRRKARMQERKTRKCEWARHHRPPSAYCLLPSAFRLPIRGWEAH